MPSPDAPLTGRCACGAVRFEVTAPFETESPEVLTPQYMLLASHCTVWSGTCGIGV